uniref:Choline/ethanolamine kinase n=1 Tax=Rhabditophanes sp. KR3021 TaxID=114890 RepID=A0AC35TLD5_9BILA
MTINTTGLELRNILAKDNSTQEVTETFKSKCVALVRNYLGGAWLNVRHADCDIKQITGGMSNILFKIDLPDNISVIGNQPKSTLLRLHGTDNAMALIIDTIIFTILSERQMGPKLYGIFDGGRFEEYIPSRCLIRTELRHSVVNQFLGKMYGKIHTLSCPINKEPMLFLSASGWINEVEKAYGSEHVFQIKTTQVNQKYLNNPIKNISIAQLRQELDILNKCMIASKSPIVFAHNDLQEGNILLKNKYALSDNGQLSSESNEDLDVDDAFTVIDYEYSNYNYRGFDFGNHFCEWGIGYEETNAPGYTINYQDFPTTKQMKPLIQCYLDELNNTSHDTTDDVETIALEAERFMPVSHFFWACWAFKMELNKEIDFGYQEYGMDRLSIYFENKHKLQEYLWLNC